MGIFDSDYKATGSVSASQLGTQRSEGDSYYGELLMLHPYNGKNYTDELLGDIKGGVTSTFRQFMRQGKLNNFETKISLSSGGAGSNALGIVQETEPTATRVTGSWGWISGAMQALIEAYNTNAFPLAVTGGTTTIIDEYVGVNNNLWFKLSNGVDYDTGIDATKPDKEGYFGTIYVKDNIGQETELKKFISTDPRFNISFEARDPLQAYPVISIQDNNNNEQPYYELGDQHAEFKRRAAVLDPIGVDFEELSRQVFDPDPIPALGSDDWIKDYKPGYDGSPELQTEYGSESGYHSSLVNSRQEMVNNIRNITDVHCGAMLSPGTLDIANAYALKGFFKEILPGLPEPKSVAPMGDLTYSSVSFDISSGSLKISHSIEGYRFGRVVGSIKDYKPNGVTMHVKNNNKIAWGVSEDFLTEADQIAADNADPFEDENVPEGGWMASLKNLETGTGGIFIATPSAATAAGEPTYEFIEIYKPFAVHHIDVHRDGEHGTSQSVDVRGGLKGVVTNEDEYSDVLLYPLTRKALKVVPIFKRERLIRESFMLIIDGIHVAEVKWYQKGIFKILIMVVGAIVSCLLSGCVTLGALIAGSSGAWATLGVFVLKAVALGLTLQVLLPLIDSPILAALVVIVAAVIVAGGIGNLNYTQMASIALEATGTYMQKEFAQEMMKMEEEAKELKAKYNKLNEEMDSIMEAAGMETSANHDWILYKASLPPIGEFPEEFHERSLKRDFAIIDQSNGMDALLSVKLPNRIN